ncbi:MAG: glycoside hydrolase family 3 C-terminal domain-containing protein [Bryocella sp.]
MLTLACCVVEQPGVAQTVSAAAAQQARPWMNTGLTPEQRAELVLAQMTLEEKLDIVHGEGMADSTDLTPAQRQAQLLGNHGVGMAVEPTRLGIPIIDMSDAAYGVRSSKENGRYSTALPSNLGSAASWDPAAACRYGTLIGMELRNQGYDMTLGGGVDLIREPRNGRSFEYMGEDPLLAGTLVGNRIKCEGAQHIISDIKHYAMNDQESGRTEVDVHASEKAMRESDLLAFQIGVKIGNPKAVMCSYNGVNGDYACENKYLLTDVLKKDWDFKGFVLSDWGGTHSTEKASASGLDMEQPEADFYGAKLKEAVLAGRVPMEELNDHVRRILWAEFASGVVDNPPHFGLVDPQKGFDVSRQIEEQSIVLLKDHDAVLPLDAGSLKSVAVIGARANYGTISGGGSAQVDAPGDPKSGVWQHKVWFPNAPLDAMQAKAPGAAFTFSSGDDIADAVAKAKGADVAVVFAWQWEAEDMDLPNLSLPYDQDKLIEAVVAANPRTIVVLETGTAVTMPWLAKADAVVEAWFPGSKGGDAIANVLFGDVNPSGKLPITFPMSESELPNPVMAKPGPHAKNGVLSFNVDYTEGAKVGYKWYETAHKAMLFPFGFGLSYTSFAYSGLTMSADGTHVSFTLTNTGKRKGAEVAEVYATIPPSANEPWKRLVGWQKVELAPGQSTSLTVAMNMLPMSVWDMKANKFELLKGKYKVMVGGSSAELPLAASFVLP